MELYQHNHTEEDGTVPTDYYSVPEDDHSPVRPEDEARDAESARLRDLWAKLDAESGYTR